MKLRLLFIRDRRSGGGLFVGLVSPAMNLKKLNEERQDALRLLEAFYEVQEIEITPEHLFMSSQKDAKEFIAGINRRRQKEFRSKR